MNIVHNLLQYSPLYLPKLNNTLDIFYSMSVDAITATKYI